MRLKILFNLILMFSVLSGFSQTIISGRVTDSNGESIPGASVLIKGTTRGTITDMDGKYQLEVQSTQDVIIYSFVGFTTKEIVVGAQSNIDISLSEDITELNEVIIVGYGTQKRKDVTSSVSTLSSDLVEDVPGAYSFDGAIQGKASGLFISTSSGTPGASINVNVRGVTSINASGQPLYVIDGIPIATSNNSALNSNIQPINPLADINPNDIESISVLKDASAAAIYGSRGANGVILIKTKRGTAGNTKVSLNYYTGISEISNTPEMMNSKEWIEFMNTAAAFDGLGENYWNDVLGDPNDPNLRDVNVYDQLFRTGITHNADVSVRGGDAKTKFFVSANYFDQTGIQKGQDFSRVSARLNLDHSINNKVGVGTSLLVSRTAHQRTINENDEYGVIVNAQAWDPTAPLRNDDGTYTNPFSYNGWWALENPLLIAKEYQNNSHTNRVLASTFVTWDILDNLQFKSSWSVDFNNLNEESFTPAGFNETPVGKGEFATWEEFIWLNENTISYSTQISDRHDINVVGGFTMQEANQDFSSIEGNGFPSNRITKLSSAANTTGSSASSSYGFQSFFGRVNYSLDGKYLVNFTVRADGSSRFGPNNKYGTFPSGSIGWRIIEESFMSGLTNILDDAKLRASYGITGNAEIGNFTWRGQWNLSSPYNGNGGSSPAVLENPDLTWERTSQLDVGADLSFLEGKIKLTTDYFVKETEDLLLPTDVPGATGFQTVISNFGKIRNKGIEFSLNTTNYQAGDFEWKSSFNYTQIKNKVVDVLNDGQILSRNFVMLEGQPLSQLYLIDFLGVDPTTGDAIFEDINSDGLINLDDRQAVGSGIPTYFGGFNNTFTYKGVSLSVFFQFAGGNKIFNQSRHAYENYGSTRSVGIYIPYGNQTKRSLDHWSQPGDITDIPRPSIVGPDHPGSPALQWQRFSTQYLEDGDYVRLKNVQLAYTLPQSITQRLKVSSLRVYAQGRNLITWTDYLGFDPEVSTNTDNNELLNTQQGEDFGTLGQARTYTIGVNIGL